MKFSFWNIKGIVLIALAQIYMYGTVFANAGPTTESDLMERLVADGSEDVRFAFNSVGWNPAAMFYARSYSLSDFSLCGDYLHCDKPYQVQTGTGYTSGNIKASSYLRLNDKTVVWGTARFTTGTSRDIKWNNSVDFDLVGPYVLADSVGGDLTSRSYSFAGGYSGESNGWTWGAYVSYLASIDYRDRDPRNKIVVSDLLLSLGGSRRLFSTYTLSLGTDIRVYNQESDVTFFNPNNEIRTYALLGLGSFNPRFSGNTNNSTAYNAFGFGAELGIFDINHHGGYLNVSFHYLPMKQILRNFNNLELTRAGNYYFSADMGYKVNTGTITLTPQLKVSARRQLGFENLFGSAVGNHYVSIGRRRNYYHDIALTKLDIPLSLSLSEELILDFVPAFSVSYDHENYRRPRRSIKISKCIPSLLVKTDWKASNSVLLSFRFSGEHSFVIQKEANLSGLDISSIMGESVRYNFIMQSDAYTTFGGKISTDLIINPSMAIFFSANCQYIRYHYNGNTIYAELAAGLKF